MPSLWGRRGVSSCLLLSTNFSMLAWACANWCGSRAPTGLLRSTLAVAFLGATGEAISFSGRSRGSAACYSRAIVREQPVSEIG